ncbi:MAG TPA: hypothetical protein PLF16_02260, partial [Candidatus Staskawiczbacteria bacterium]|nr:hypothetical protein [Candidatus Staskawiczbacteria bacterium]
MAQATTHYWLGGSDGNEGSFATAANWSTGGVPAAGDTIIFDGRAGTATGSITGHTNGYNWNCIDDCNQYTKNFAKIQITSSYTGSIGTGWTEPNLYTSALRCTWDELIISGSGTYYLNADADGTTNTATKCDLTIID